MAHAAAAAAVPLRRPLLFLKEARLLSTLATPLPGLRHPRALRPTGPLPSDAEDTDDPDAGDGAAVSFKKSRNELKREARRAVKWGMDLAKFSPPQIKRILSAASLEREVFDALMLVKKFGPDVREGRRRQFNYIGSLLRDAQPELMDTLIQASKDGDERKLYTLLSEGKLLVEEEEEEEEDLPDGEENQEYMKIADRWFDGLLCKDISVTNEVYSVHSVEFDRQELRKLVKRAHMFQESTQNKDGEESNAKLSGAKKPLMRFLRSLAKEAYAP
ncbi:hypothetical protein Zm00014a_042149 [Zea mays]|uniref:Kinesin heavy chain isolog n=1 Tax=Zea mays TaxID=4577 RepID=A0A3L6G396_MAIZE|nr:hypothetical protein Zm00014a_042149 [Zea mays]